MEGAACWGQGLEGRVQAQHRLGSELGRRAVGLEEPGGVGQLFRTLADSQARVQGSLTARVTTDDEFSDFIIDKDEDAVGSGTEPPGYPEESKSWSAGAEIEGPVKGRCREQRPGIEYFVCCVGG